MQNKHKIFKSTLPIMKVSWIKIVLYVGLIPHSCKSLLQLFLAELLKQDNLTIVVTKIDLAILNQDDDDDKYDEELLTSEVQKYLCEKVFEISMTDLPKDVIFPVCGKWALMVKQLQNQNHPSDKIIINRVQKELDYFASTLDDQHEAPIDEKALWLLERSNIDKLESRYSQMNIIMIIANFSRLNIQYC